MQNKVDSASLVQKRDTFPDKENNLREIYNRNPDFIFRKIVDEMILVPIHKNVADMDAIFSLNDVASFIWAQMEQPRTLEELQGALIKEFDAQPEVIQSDLHQFLAEMLDIGAVVRG